ncbi:MAG: TIR domain-containing protein [Clostridia bacterium]|nr:TIR domain-containing protein [Clostridia bacterium]
MIYKCKMCGGELDILGNEHICKCPFCGTTQTIPEVDKEKTLALFNRATDLLQAFEYDKASSIYEQINIYQGACAEAYWGICLCKYGVEYVEDPKTFRRIPTCHRINAFSILNDKEYLKAIELADSISKEYYISEATYIDKVQKKIIDISRKEKPYDIFICYKETDDIGGKTEDSLIAEDIYNSLIRNGYNVFFSKISLKDKIGQEYEPYIYAALNSATIMILIGTRKDYFNSPWVKNEWIRFFDMMNRNKKYLIPCYKNMLPKDMPKELVNLQSINLGEIGFDYDLIRGINKLLPHKTDDGQKNNGTESFEEKMIQLKKYIKKGEFKLAENLCEELLLYNKNISIVLFYKFLCLCKVNEIEFVETIHCYRDIKERNIDDNVLFAKNNQIFLSAYEKAKEQDKEYLDSFLTRIEELKNDKKRQKKWEEYQSAIELKKNAKTLSDFRKLIQKFKDLGDFEDSKKQLAFYENKIYEEDLKKTIYDYLLASIRPFMSYAEREKIVEGFEYLDDYEDAKKYVNSFYRNSSKKEVASKDMVLEEISSIKLDLGKINNELKKIIERINADYSKDVAYYDDISKKKRGDILRLSEELSKCGIFERSKKSVLKDKIREAEQEYQAHKNDTNIVINKLTEEKNDKIQIVEREYFVKRQELESRISKLQEIIDNETKEEIIKNSEIDYWKLDKSFLVSDSLGYVIHVFKLGKYPQGKVVSKGLIDILEKEHPDSNGIYSFFGLEFVKRKNNYYVILPIEWTVEDCSNSQNGSNILLSSRKIIDFKPTFLLNGIKTENIDSDFEGILSNKITGLAVSNYNVSHIREWLNNDFYCKCFNEDEKQMIVTTIIDNGPETVVDETNEHCCNNCEDNVFLPSYRLLRHTSYGKEKTIDDYLNIKEKNVYEANSSFAKKELTIGIDINKELCVREFDVGTSDINLLIEFFRRIGERNNFEINLIELSDLKKNINQENYYKSEYLFGAGETDYVHGVVDDYEDATDEYSPNERVNKKIFRKISNKKEIIKKINFSTILTRSPTTDGKYFVHFDVNVGEYNDFAELDYDELNSREDIERDYFSFYFGIKPFITISFNKKQEIISENEFFKDNSCNI